MDVWIDLTNSPHVLVMRPVIERLRAQGHDVSVTARAFAQTLELCERHGLAYDAIGRHRGGRLAAKAGGPAAASGAPVPRAPRPGAAGAPPVRQAARVAPQTTRGVALPPLGERAVLPGARAAAPRGRTRGCPGGGPPEGRLPARPARRADGFRRPRARRRRAVADRAGRPRDLRRG